MQPCNDLQNKTTCSQQTLTSTFALPRDCAAPAAAVPEDACACSVHCRCCWTYACCCASGIAVSIAARAPRAACGVGGRDDFAADNFSRKLQGLRFASPAQPCESSAASIAARATSATCAVKGWYVISRYVFPRDARIQMDHICTAKHHKVVKKRNSATDFRPNRGSAQPNSDHMQETLRFKTDSVSSKWLLFRWEMMPSSDCRIKIETEIN